jgi:UDP-N-acetylglucosamine 2-epimerase (non-hydrolysing)
VSAALKVLVVVGARPNFVKVAPVVHALAALGVQTPVVNTGQHYDRVLADAFLEQLDFPAPSYELQVGSGTHAEQTAAVLVGLERVLLDDPPDVVLVAGDVNSTLAAALAAAKLNVPVAHLEAGLRSGDWTMPEEVNRVLTDRLSALLLVHSESAVENLRAEGIDPERTAFVGNTMIDSLLRLLPAARAAGAVARLGLEPGGFVLVTLHRPSLVDDPEHLASVLAVLDSLADGMPVVFPVHPRTRARIQTPPRRARIVDPLEYLDFVALQEVARLVITDSGGVQEETSALGVPCLTYRTTTERPITVERGTNRLIGAHPDALRTAAAEALDAPHVTEAPAIPLWDGAAGPRAAGAVVRRFRRDVDPSLELRDAVVP